MDANYQGSNIHNAQDTGMLELLERVMRFGFQNGVPAHKVKVFQQSVFERFSATAAKTELEIQLYKAAIINMPSFTKDGKGEDEYFRFPEDLQTHRAILVLDAKERIVITLGFLQHQSIESISEILGQPTSEVHELISRGLSALQSKLGVQNAGAVQKRLEFAAKSYERINFNLSEDEESAKEEIQIVGAKARPKPLAGRSKVLLATAGLFLAGVLGTSFAIDSAKPDLPLTAAEAKDKDQLTIEMLDVWKKQYEDIRESSPERLGIDSNTYNQLEYVKKADQQMKRLFKKEQVEKMKNEQKKMQRQMDILILQIETPRVMLALLDGAYYTSEETQVFVKNYALKTRELMEVSEVVLLDHEKELEEVAVNGELSEEKLLSGRGGYSNELQNLLDSVGERGLTVIKHPLEKRFIIRRDMDAYYSSGTLNSDYEVNNYMSLLMQEPFFDKDGLVQPISHMTFIMTSIESSLLEDRNSSNLYVDFEQGFQHAFWLMLKGSETRSVFDNKGVVKKEYQETWIELSRQGRNPLIYVMLPILEEMEASGWTSSASYEALDDNDIMEAVELERADKLAAKLPNGDVQVETEIIQLDQYDFSETEKLYQAFSAQHDLALLENVPPLDVYLLFQYANIRSDAETTWHLLSGETKPSLEEYKRIWRQQDDFRKHNRSIAVHEEQINRVGSNLHLYLEAAPKKHDDYMFYTPIFVMDDKAIWLVQNHLYEKYDLREKESEYSKNVNVLYNELRENLNGNALHHASPGEIAGLLLEAYEEQDFDLLPLLFEEGAEIQDVDELLRRLKERSIPQFSDAQNVVFYTDSFYYGYRDIEQGTFQFDTRDSSDRSMNQLTMVKTPAGWRFGDLNKY